MPDGIELANVTALATKLSHVRTVQPTDNYEAATVNNKRFARALVKNDLTWRCPPLAQQRFGSFKEELALHIEYLHFAHGTASNPQVSVRADSWMAPAVELPTRLTTMPNPEEELGQSCRIGFDF